LLAADDFAVITEALTLVRFRFLQASQVRSDLANKLFINSIERIAFPNNGRLVVWATARATNAVPRPPVPKGIVVTQEIRSSVLSQRGIRIQNGSGAMELAVREGMSVSVNGTSKVISSLLSPTDAEPFKSRKTLCSDSNGMVVTTATFTDGTQGILKITP